MSAPGPYSLAHLDDDALLGRLGELVARDQRHTAALLAHLAEVDARRIYRQAACASLFAYCTEVLRYAEGAAYKRIAAARAARRFPFIYDLIVTGELHLTAVSMLAPHLDAENHVRLLRAAVHCTKREVEELIAAHAPRPDVPTLVRRLREPSSAAGPSSDAQSAAPATAALVLGAAGEAPSDGADNAPPESPLDAAAAAAAECSRTGVAASAPQAPGIASSRSEIGTSAPVNPTSAAAGGKPALLRPPPGSVVAPLAPDRYRVQFTASRALRDKLYQAQQLLRRGGRATSDLPDVIERALDVLLRDLRRRKYGACSTPRSDQRLRRAPVIDPPTPAAPARSAWTASEPPPRAAAPPSPTPAATGLPPAHKTARRRHIPQSTLRVVSRRDQERCAFVDPRTGKRCTATALLHLHHRRPWGRGGSDEADNLSLFCAAHDGLQAELEYGLDLIAARVAARRAGVRGAPGQEPQSATAPGDSPKPAGNGRPVRAPP